MGLRVEQNIKRPYFRTDEWYDSDEKTAVHVFHEKVVMMWPQITEMGKTEEARVVWLELWKKATQPRPSGQPGVHAAVPLYICVGRKS